ncbi:MAG: hypothetical protein HC795_04170 [Coleofasciculaceae cyanobacterium RL_1_1]|nr:hypothetical protein [Coleofasciculaceae cyanobacterium RL_1_1]
MIEALTDGLLLVGRPGFTQTSLVAEQANAIEEAGEKLTVIGSVVNGAEITIELPPLPDDEELLDEATEVTAYVGEDEYSDGLELSAPDSRDRYL